MNNNSIRKILSFYAGVKAGLYRFAWMKDGVMYVGTTGTTYKQAITEVDAERGLADAALADQNTLDAAFFRKALIGSDDGQAHDFSPSIDARRKPGLPVLRVRAGMNAFLSDSGQALNLVSDTR